MEGPGCEDYDNHDFSQDKLGPCLLGFKISVILGERRRNVAQSKHRELHSKISLNKVIIPCVPQTAPKHKGANNTSIYDITVVVVAVSKK